MNFKEMMLHRVLMYTTIAWLWLIIACVIAFNASKIEIIMNNMLISLIIYMVITYLIINIKSIDEIKTEVE